jgi:hypothetical protein
MPNHFRKSGIHLNLWNFGKIFLKGLFPIRFVRSVQNIMVFGPMEMTWIFTL